MILAVDANIIIAALIKDSKSREIIIGGKFTLVSPDYIREELDKHKDYISRKGKIPRAELDLLITLLLRKIRIVPSNEYKDRMGEAREMIEKDLADAPYVACFLALKCDGIWTSDLDYAGKSQLKVFDTKYLSKLLGH
jgi:predicted nucleic acid-binding protein